MKKRLIVIFILIFSTVLFCSQYKGKRLGRKKLLKTRILKLISPVDQWKFKQLPVKVDFKWVHPGDVDNFSLFIETFEMGKWKSDLIKSNIRVNHYSIEFNKNKDFRWRVVAKRGNALLYQSVWRYCKYVGGRLVPKFYPVPLEPTNKKLFKNYPRKMTFKWLHSTDPGYRRYQLQVDIYHPRPRKWRSEFKEMTYLLDTITKKTSFKYTFPADRRGRWRVRGVATGKRYTPWTKWRTFKFEALH